MHPLWIAAFATCATSSDPLSPARAGVELTLQAGALEVRGVGGTPLELRLATWGRGERAHAAGPPSVRRRGARVELAREGLVEWYVGLERGLEHGFTVLADPEPGEAGPLELVLEPGAGWRAEVSPDGRDACFLPAGGGGRIPYTGLCAWDARGRELAARMRVESGRLVLAVDDAGAAYPLTIDPLLRFEDAKLWAADGATDDWFGGGNAGQGLALDGDTLVVGAPWDDDNGDRSGAAYVFVRQGGGWVQQAKLVPAGGSTADWTGAAVAVSGDRALIGSDNDDELGNNAGAAWVFARAGGTWSEEAKLLAGDGADFDDFGHALALDGDTAVVGAFNHDALFQNAGAVYVYVRSGTSWSQQAKLLASDGAAEDHFGKAVALEGDTLVVGARWADPVGPQTGAAYVFTRSGTSWSEQAKLVAPDVTDGAAFGFHVALSGDTALISALGDDTLAPDAGAAYVFTRTGTSWSQQARLRAPDFEERDFFGFSLDLDGDLALVSAYQEDALGLNPGKAYVFERVGAEWLWRAELRAHDGAPDVDFGRAAALSGTTAAVSSPHAEGAAFDSGAAYVFELEPQPAVTSTCFGDGGGTPCPCANESWTGSHAGCANSGANGGLLFASGGVSVAADDLRLHARHLLPGQPALAFLGLNTVGGGAGVAFGDGLRCAGGSAVRLGVETPDAQGAADYGPGLAVAAQLTPGDARTFQVWYRDPVGPCATGFSLTNALEAVFGP